MGNLYQHVYLILIVTVFGVEAANTDMTTGGRETSSGWSNMLQIRQIQKGGFTSTSCLWGPVDKSATCKGMYLEAVPSRFPRNTLELNLANNEITTLLNTSFEPYPNLVTLDVASNKIRTIESAAFQPLQRLENLYLYENFDLVISSSAPFQPLAALVILELRCCNLVDLPTDILEWFPNLRNLDLSGNLLSSLNLSRCQARRQGKLNLVGNRFKDLSPEKFIVACPTDILQLVMNPITYIWEDAIAPLSVNSILFGKLSAPTEAMLTNISSGVARSTIKHVMFSDMELFDIPLGVFKPLYDHPLEILSIERSGDVPLYRSIFVGLNRLEKLFLIHNFFQRIEPEYFEGMPSLQILILRDNQIMHINPNNASWESNLRYLDLSMNKMYSVEDHDLRGLDNLEVLNLSNNEQLVALTLCSCGDFENLKKIYVTGTRLIDLSLVPSLTKFVCTDHIPRTGGDGIFTPGRTFNDTKLLTFLDLSHSELTSGNLWDSSDNLSLFHGLVVLQQLRLSRNPVGNLPEGVFEDSSLLTYLTMEQCQISSLSAHMFKGLQSLVYLGLDGNRLVLIATDALTKLPVLETLSISNNLIMFVEEGAMEKVRHLRSFNLSNNQLVAFNRSTWNTLMENDLEYIDVSRNPLSCKCNYGWLHYLSNSSQMFLRHNETICSVDSLDELRGKPFLEFDPSQYCVPNILLFSTLPFAALALLIGGLLAFHNRWLIRYKLFLIKLAIIGYTEMQDARDHDEFVFDINIMFTEADEAWAREHMRPTLEGRLPDYDRYSFGDDDLILGMHYLDAVHYAVEHSFKTIMLLSRRAVRDNWFLIKFRTAMDHVHDELIENTVVIFLEDIPEDEIPYLVRLYLSDRRPYMRWPEDVRGHEYFWNKLTKVVTINLKYNPLIPPE